MCAELGRSVPVTSRGAALLLKTGSKFSHEDQKSQEDAGYRPHSLPRRQVEVAESHQHTTPANVRRPRPNAEFREPFLGAGAVGLSLLAANPGIKRAWLNDADPAMAALWDTVIDNPTSLHVFVEVLPEAMRLFPKNDYYQTTHKYFVRSPAPETCGSTRQEASQR